MEQIKGMLTFCDVVTTLQIQKGDILVFKETPKTPYTHIAIFMADNGDGTGVFFYILCPMSLGIV
ncbi:MAG: hypothetical protein RR531_04710 [Longicatena sp.]